MIDSLFDSLANKNHKIPAYNITVTDKKGSKDITNIVTDRLISLAVIDNRGFDADEMDLLLTDHDGALALPSRGAKIAVSIGWKGEGLVKKGEFTVDEIQYAGTPDTLTIRARSADLRGSLNTKKERSFHDITLGDLIAQLAAENQLKGYCGVELENEKIDHLDQTNESTVNLLTRLADQYDAIATVKNGVLLFMQMGMGQSASGNPLPEMLIEKQSGDSYNFTLAESDNYTAVRAYWHDPDTGKKGEIVVDENTKIERKSRTTKKGKQSKRKYNTVNQAEPVESDADQMKTLRHTYKTEQSALNAAKAAFDRMKRGVATFTLTLAEGDPMLMPELPVIVQGFKPAIDSTQWIISKVTHNISDSGFTTVAEMEIKMG